MQQGEWQGGQLPPQILADQKGEFWIALLPAPPGFLTLAAPLTVLCLLRNLMEQTLALVKAYYLVYQSFIGLYQTGKLPDLWQKMEV